MKIERYDNDGITYLTFMCPGCNVLHQVDLPRWAWNGSLEAPTFTPSVLVTWEAVPEAAPGFEEWRKARACHSFVTDGRIKFLGDCTHALAGQEVDLPEYD